MSRVLKERLQASHQLGNLLNRRGAGPRAGERLFGLVKDHHQGPFRRVAGAPKSDKVGGWGQSIAWRLQASGERPEQADFGVAAEVDDVATLRQPRPHAGIED